MDGRDLSWHELYGIFARSNHMGHEEYAQQFAQLNNDDDGTAAAADMHPHGGGDSTDDGGGGEYSTAPSSMTRTNNTNITIKRNQQKRSKNLINPAQLIQKSLQSIRIDYCPENLREVDASKPGRQEAISTAETDLVDAMYSAVAYPGAAEDAIAASTSAAGSGADAGEASTGDQSSVASGADSFFGAGDAGFASSCSTTVSGGGGSTKARKELSTKSKKSSWHCSGKKCLAALSITPNIRFKFHP